jgi:predicted secreted protein
MAMSVRCFATFRERLPMKLIRTPSMAWALMTALALPVASVQAQNAASSPHATHAQLNQVLHLSASAQTEVAQDWLVITLSVQKEGLQAPAVQKQLNAVVSAALAVATPMAKPGTLEVKTGDMNVSPRYGREGKMNGWVGSAQLVLQGRDVEQITTLAGRMPDLTVSQIDWRLSSEQKSAAEARIQAEAVAHFQSKAQSLTKQFGFATYTLKDVRVSAQEAGEGQVMPRMAMAQMDAPSPMPVPAVAGKSRVVVTISGSIVLR